MTCIVGLVDDKELIMGGDSAGVSGTHIEVRKDVKVFRNGDFIIGCTSSFRMIQLLQYSFKPPVRDISNIHKYMCTDFIDEVKNCFRKGSFLQKFSDGDAKGGTFLVGYEGRLFTVHSDFQVAENTDPWNSVGCGRNYALGSLYSTKDSDMTSKQRVTMALKSAVNNNGGVRPPFVYKTMPL